MQREAERKTEGGRKEAESLIMNRLTDYQINSKINSQTNCQTNGQICC